MWWLTLVTLVALVLRILVVYQARGAFVGGGDGYMYSLEANQNIQGHWFENLATRTPDALHPPAWTLLLTALAWFGGQSWISMQLLASLIGTATVVMIGLAGRHIAGERAGLVAPESRPCTPGFGGTCSHCIPSPC